MKQASGAWNTPAVRFAATVHQVVFAWMLRHDVSVISVFSASNVEQMRENLGALNVTPTEARMTRLNDASA